ncbi:Oidioi.mRNA.OKI2018_I69.XSR.g15550.t1.cds [Oikopleura dioica]|uniref:Oidioi.mRNA.OKI2018_I69.XSR.g15550.t1.cds n=1 Tax=Oikopleura dioica TaxID=34765 RepID=A0ABN7SJL7_OIKDI|nr:Oidioi.mRNA.OKI2018_I69.XSR.g15550.t1.cds [Oikopleura dioica]
MMFFSLFQSLMAVEIRVTKSSQKEYCPTVYTFVGPVVSGYFKRTSYDSLEWTEGHVSLNKTESGVWIINKSSINSDGFESEVELLRSKNAEACPPREVGAWECGTNTNCELEDIRRHTKIYAKHIVVETDSEVMSQSFDYCAPALNE